MDLYEYQARDIFEAHGVPVLRGITATTPAEAKEAAAAIGTLVVVVKAQVKTGGRGKAGGVKIAKSPDEAEARAAEMLGLDIKGHVVRTVMIAEGANIAEEYYFSLLLDRAERRYLAMCSKEGGMDITLEGTYKAEKDSFTMTLKVNDMEHTQTIKVTKITDTMMNTEDKDGKKVELERKKAKK